jgi:adenylate cyclase
MMPVESRLRDLRLATGHVLAAFLICHFLNHALGLISLTAMEAGRAWFIAIWARPLAQVVLYVSLLVHFLLALLALYRRKTLRMPGREAAQLLLGLALPFLLVEHVAGTRIELALSGRVSAYPDVVRLLWILAPERGVMQAVALVVAWLHGCFGIWFWLRSKPRFPRYAPLLFAVALLVPVLSLLGFAEAGKQLAAQPATAGFAPDPRLMPVKMMIYTLLAGAIGIALLLRLVRLAAVHARRVRITYPDGRTISVPRGFTVLEASRSAGIPHLSSCGGKGRCSTCRVRIVHGNDDLAPPSPTELMTLSRIKAGPDVRLACQIRPLADVTVTPILAAASAAAALRMPRRTAPGTASHEHEVAVLFCDLRGFTRLSERRLPYDTVFVLNRYFEVVGAAVEESGGYLDKFIGDGALALFGLNGDADAAARQALAAARRIAVGLGLLNELLRDELGEPLRIAMGLHAGGAIVGEMVYGPASSLTAVGDTINTASRLEGIAKELDAELVVSVALAHRAGIDMTGHEHRIVMVRGRKAEVPAWILRQADALPEAGL